MGSHPAKIGKYSVEGVLGRGGMGVVFKAVNSQIGRYVAIKMITGGGDETLIERFKSEAKMMGALQFPNIVTVYDYGEQDGNPYLVMQYLEGQSLEAMLRKGISLTLSESLGIVIDVCHGLDYAHQRGVIHRDIKPGNIIVLQDGINDGMAVIVDFGIARIMGDTGVTKASQIIGSIHYMSAEQLQAEALDNRTDIYSIGVVLFQLLTGELPFDANETRATFLKITNDSPPFLGDYLKEYPTGLDGIINRVLARNRDQRYGTAKDLAFDLIRIRDQMRLETVSQLVSRAEAAVEQEEWTQARDLLQQTLRIDRHNVRAHKLMNAVSERLRLRKEIERARALRGQANEAYIDKRYDDALRLLDQAVGLDSKNPEILSFRDIIRASKERATRLRRALRRAEAAPEDGDLDEAQRAADDAFQIDPEDTQAKALRLIVFQACRREIAPKSVGEVTRPGERAASKPRSDWSVRYGRIRSEAGSYVQRSAQCSEDGRFGVRARKTSIRSAGILPAGRGGHHTGGLRPGCGTGGGRSSEVSSGTNINQPESAGGSSTGSRRAEEICSRTISCCYFTVRIRPTTSSVTDIGPCHLKRFLEIASWKVCARSF